MLPKNQRLTTEDFEKYFKIGRRHHGQYLQVAVSPSSDFHGSVAVGKKVYKNAVDRNRLRRRLYDVMRNQAPLAGVYICIVKPGAEKVPYSQMKADLETVLAKLSTKQVQ